MATAAIVTVVAWLVGTHHCLLGALADAQKTASETCPHCPGHCEDSDAQNKAPSAMLACCQGLVSPGVELAQAKVKFDPILLGLQALAVDRLIRFDTVCSEGLSTKYDTGPPGGSCFVATVLKRSLRENAPPFSV